MRRCALTAIGPHRPSTAAAVINVLYSHDCAIGDSNMMLLDNVFVMNLILTLPKRKRLDTVKKDLDRLTVPPMHAVNINELGAAKKKSKSPLSDFIVTLHGKNRPGIIQKTCELFRSLGANITSLESKVVPGIDAELYIVMVEGALEGATFKKVEAGVRTLGKGLNMKTAVRPVEPFGVL